MTYGCGQRLMCVLEWERSRVLASRSSGTEGGEAVGCTYKGYFYLVTEDGLSVVLPSISVSSNFFPVEAIGHRQKTVSTATASQAGILFESKGIKQKSFLPWKIELLDRLLLLSLEIGFPKVVIVVNVVAKKKPYEDSISNIFLAPQGEVEDPQVGQEGEASGSSGESNDLGLEDPEDLDLLDANLAMPE
ncbi:hypothetical protein POM88_021328 [Heracleum sosnowskyi]|uniref:Uncharacterized protein n=1 Tax=Heracleum sosnowskyi TaxID=360622 RepID=A0AAD8IFN3_9APIA|nr:hypothetical protein POM88_021328 [Heracleum sosnowskyi]